MDFIEGESEFTASTGWIYYCGEGGIAFGGVSLCGEMLLANLEQFLNSGINLTLYKE